jgi:hypothetical protein
MARPSKLTSEVEARIVEAVELGATWERAADAAGIGASTLREWRQRGEADEAPFAAFVAALKRAEGDGVARALRTIRQAAESGTWQAAAWLLERRYPADYGRRVESRVDVSTSSPESGVASLLIALTKLTGSDEERERENRP